MRVAVVIPVYGVEKYIRRHAVSMFEQTMRDDICFIYVNDCTKDKSIEILKETLEEYPHRKPQTYILNQPRNMKVAAARQRGLEKALELNAEYIIHADPDDWVDREMYEEMYEKASATKAKLVICDYAVERAGLKGYQSQKPLHNDSEYLLKSISGVLRHPLHGSLCNKLIHRSLLEDVVFIKNINYREDVCVMFQVCKSDFKIAHLPKAYYHYCFNSVSNIRSFSDIKNEECVNLVKAFYGLGELNDSKWYVDCCQSAIESVYYYVIRNSLELAIKDADTIKNYLTDINCNRQLRRIDKTIIKKCLRKNVKYISVWIFMAKMINKIYNLRMLLNI